MPDQDFYRCLQCGGDFIFAGDDEEAACAACGARYPSVGGVRVLVARPWGLVAAWGEKLAAAHRHLEQQAQQLVERAASLPATVRDHAERLREGLELNRSLLDRCFEPARRARERSGHRPGLADAPYYLLCGWDPDLMLPYFYQDWGDTAELTRLEQLIGPSLERHAPGRESLTVLASGAGGLAHRLASGFGRTQAIELALPAQLVVAKILDGERVRYCLVARPGTLEFATVTLDAPASRPAGLSLLAADVHDLPMPSASQDAVLSQYLLDVVPNPGAVAAEALRVLRPGGIWTNLGLPFRVPSDPGLLWNRTDEDVGPFLEEHGFEVLELRREPYSLCKMTSAIPTAGEYRQSPIFFVARRRATATAPPTALASMERFVAGDEDAAVWDLRPRLAPGHELGFLSGKGLSATGERTKAGLQIDGGPVMEVPAAMASTLERLFSWLDGKQTLRTLRARIPIPERDLLSFFRVLQRMDLVTWDTA